MKPWEHYVEAENILQTLGHLSPVERMKRIAEAQVHATLALVVEGTIDE